MRKIGLAIYLTVIVSCGRVPETHYYTLDRFSAEEMGSAEAGTLIIQSFKTEPPYHQDKFVYRPSEFEIRFDHYRRWIQPPPGLMTTRLIEFMRTTKSFDYVGSRRLNREENLNLVCTLNQFGEIQDGRSHVFKVAFQYQLFLFPQNKLLGTGEALAGEPIAGESSEDIVIAANKAVKEVFSQLYQQLIPLVKRN